MLEDGYAASGHRYREIRLEPRNQHPQWHVPIELFLVGGFQRFLFSSISLVIMISTINIYELGKWFFPPL